MAEAAGKMPKRRRQPGQTPRLVRPQLEQRSGLTLIAKPTQALASLEWLQVGAIEPGMTTLSKRALMNAPRVSVVIPCRDDGRFLEEALASIAAQTLPAREVLVVDDGSTEAQTRQLFDSWSRSDARLVRLGPVGVSAARNLAIAQARGEFILPLDADDRIAPRYLELAVQPLEREPRVGIVECEAELFGDAFGPWTRPPFRMPHFLLGNSIVPAALFRKTDFERTRGYNPNMVHGWEDFDLWLSFLELGLGVTRLPETLFFYRQRPHSRSRRLGQERRTACAYARILLNHKRLYARHPQILPRYAARMARAALRELTISSRAASSRRA